MVSWAELAAAEPAFARRVQERFELGRHKTLATLRRDGSPRISGTELRFADGEVTLGMMAASRKLDDVRRDPRVAIHSPTADEPVDGEDWAGDAKLAGVLVAIPAPADQADAGFFRVDVTEAVVTSVVAQELVVDSWTASGGLRHRTRS